MTYGKFIIATGEIPAGSDAAKLFPLFSSGRRCSLIQFASYYGGDSGEFAQLVLVPPTVVINGTTGVSDHPGCIAITPAEYMGGAIGTADKQWTFGADNGGRGTAYWGGFTIPPGYQIAIQQDTANTVAWSVTVGAYELEY